MSAVVNLLLLDGAVYCRKARGHTCATAVFVTRA